MGTGIEQNHHLKEENCFAIEMSEVISTEIKELETTPLKISKEPEIEIKGNDEGENLRFLLKMNSSIIFIIDKILEDNSLLEDPSFAQMFNSLPSKILNLMNLNLNQGESLLFNIILINKLTALLNLNDSVDLEHNSTDCSSEGDENNENTSN